MRKQSWRVAQEEGGSSLVHFLTQKLGSLGAVLVARGAVYVQGKRCREAQRALHEGDTVLAVLEESGQSTSEAQTVQPPLQIVCQDADWMVVNKPAGVVAQPTAGRVGDSLLDAVSRQVGHAAGLVHRLDRETSGLTVFAKTEEATRVLAAQFREGSVRKRYLAVTGPVLPERGRIELPLSKDPRHPGRYRASAHAQGVWAATAFLRLFHSDAYALVAVYPETGRTHQIRAHLTAQGAPIVGDKRYGGSMLVNGRGVSRCLLHAHALLLAHPRTGREVYLEAPLALDMVPFFEEAQTAVPQGPW